MLKFRMATAFLLMIMAFPGCSSDGPSSLPAGPDRQGDANSGNAVQAAYTGSARCGDCHARNYHSWLSTWHAGALASPTVMNMQAAPPAKDVQDAIPGLAGGDGAWSIEVGKPGGGQESLRVEFVMGGPRRRLFVASGPGGKSVVPPLQIDAATGAPCLPDAADGATDDWVRDCAGCHVTGLQVDGGAWKETGVGCESCHGPGARHANAKDPGRPGTIFNPGNIPDSGRAIMVCGRCHTRGISAKGRAYPDGYEPGMDFRAGFSQAAASDQRFFWPDGSPRASRLQYPDFGRSDMRRRGVTCWSCHDPHKSSENNGAGLRMTGGSLCRTCHPRGAGPDGPVHALHGNAACRTCHMPLTAGPAPGGDSASHAFRPITPSATLTLGSGEVSRQPNSCNLCHYHGKQPPEQLETFLMSRSRQQYDDRLPGEKRARP